MILLVFSNVVKKWKSCFRSLTELVNYFHAVIELFYENFLLHYNIEFNESSNDEASVNLLYIERSKELSRKCL